MQFYSISFATATTKSSKSISYHNNKSITSIKTNIRSIQFAFSAHSRGRHPIASEFHAGRKASAGKILWKSAGRPTACSDAALRYDARRRRVPVARMRPWEPLWRNW
jgi:hypothetical protein